MSKSQHAPGPWVVDGKSIKSICHQRHYTLARVDCKYFTDDANRDNARLIAAAPDLLAALENARNVLAGLAVGDLKSIAPDSPALQQARAAIAKATGEE